MPRIERALISVTDKTDLVPFASALDRMQVELISTGGTAKLLREQGLPVRDVSEVTGFPEMLDGRVKTIHPRVAAGILAVRSEPAHMRALAEHNIAPIQMVVVNLYQFEKIAAQSEVDRRQLLEHVDIGGPTMIRAAAKNFADVAVVVSPGQYAAIIDEMERNGGGLSEGTHWRLAQTAFAHTAAYDQVIAARLAQIDASGAGLSQDDELPAVLKLALTRSAQLRYGENPHQRAALYGYRSGGIAGAQQLQGKELSFNNLVDLDAAWQLVCEMSDPTAAIIKHTNPCGCAAGDSLAAAYRAALAADPVSAFGGVLAFNRELDEETAREVSHLFVEAIAAPAYSAGALAVFKAKKNLRLLTVSPGVANELVLRSISGGVLAQTADTTSNEDGWRVVTLQAPSDQQMRALRFSWKVAKHVKSNAIVFGRDRQIISVGAGQMSRVDSVKVAAMKAILPLSGAVAASDAFFPFPDGLELAASHGITAVVQPGGSVRDQDVIEAANRLGVAMVFTGIRHFRH